MFADTSEEHFEFGESAKKDDNGGDEGKTYLPVIGINQKMAARGGPKSPAWDALKQRLVSARITDALLSPKFYMNGRKFTALRTIGEGGYSTVFEVFDTDKQIYALKVPGVYIFICSGSHIPIPRQKWILFTHTSKQNL
jgi:hypothetical protein